MRILPQLFCAIWKKDVSALNFTLLPLMYEKKPRTETTHSVNLSTNCSIRTLRFLRLFTALLSEIQDIRTHDERKIKNDENTENYQCW